MLKEFTSRADGDFIFQIINGEGLTVIFNDLVGRLPVYSYNSKNEIFISSEINKILMYKNSISVSKRSLLEFLLYEYQIGNDTLFSDVKKMGANSLIYITGFDISEHVLSMLFTEKKERIDKKHFIDTSISLIQESVKNRVNYFTNDYKIQVDISGGLDSRVIAHFTSSYPGVYYQTFEYVQDESYIAKHVLQECGVDIGSFYSKYDGLIQFNLEESIPYVIANDALVNLQSNYICSKDLEIAKIHNEGKVARFTGLGFTDYIRKYPYNFKSIVRYLSNENSKVGFLKNLDKLVEFVDFDINIYRKKLLKFRDEFAFDNDFFLLYLYHDFQRNYVSLSSEDRERNIFWTVPSMFSSNLIKFVSVYLQPGWIGYSFFHDFMFKLNPRLKDIPLFNRRISLRFNFILRLYDVFNNLRTSYWFFKIQDVFSVSRNLIKDDPTIVQSINGYLASYNDYDFLRKNSSLVTGMSSIEKSRLLTVLIYLDYFKSNNKKIYFND